MLQNVQKVTFHTLLFLYTTCKSHLLFSSQCLMFVPLLCCSNPTLLAPPINSTQPPGGRGHVNLGTRARLAASDHYAAVAAGHPQSLLSGRTHPGPSCTLHPHIPRSRRRAWHRAGPLRGHFLCRPVLGRERQGSSGSGDGVRKGGELRGCCGNQLTCSTKCRKWTTELNKHLNNQSITLISIP